MLGMVVAGVAKAASATPRRHYKMGSKAETNNGPRNSTTYKYQQYGTMACTLTYRFAAEARLNNI
jgi:hypothetical protein